MYTDNRSSSCLIVRRYTVKVYKPISPLEPALFVEDKRYVDDSTIRRRTRINEPLAVSWDVRLLSNGLLEIQYGLIRGNGDLEFKFTWPCISMRSREHPSRRNAAEDMTHL